MVKKDGKNRTMEGNERSMRGKQAGKLKNNENLGRLESRLKANHKYVKQQIYNLGRRVLELPRLGRFKQGRSLE